MQPNAFCSGSLYNSQEVGKKAAVANLRQIAELVAIRTFMKLKVLDAIPEEGSISLKDLSAATGVQASLLGMIDTTCQYGQSPQELN